MVGLVETVRNRVLRFALDINDQLGEDQESVAQLPAETVERSVINNIYGGNVFIAAHAETISQVAHTNIVAGDASGLFKALSNLGVTEEGLKALQHDIEADQHHRDLVDLLKVVLRDQPSHIGLSAHDIENRGVQSVQPGMVS